MPEVSISFSWATLARKYPLSGVRSVPTMDRATWCRTPAAASAARRLRPEVSKNSSTALSSNEGELARSIATCAPAMASLSPSPVMVLTPVFGAAAIASCPFCFTFSTTFDPIKPVPPITTIFMTLPLVAGFARLRHRGAVSVQGCICAAQLGVARSGFVRARCESFLHAPAADLAIKERYVLVDRRAANVQAIRREVWVGIANRQATQNQQFRGDRQLHPNDLRIPRDRDFDARPQTSFSEGQQQRLQIHPRAQGVRWAEVPVHADNADQRRAEELPVAQDSGCMLRHVLGGDSHCPVDLSA